MRAATKWRMPVPVSEQFRMSGVTDVDQCQTTISPGPVGDVVGDDCVVKCDAIAFGPRRLFATGGPHARQMPPAHFLRSGRMGDVDDNKYVVGVTVEQR